MTPEQKHVLYTDDDGELSDLYEVQLLDDALRQARVEPLRAMLDDDSAVVRFDSLQILVAWGDPTALERVLELLRSGSDELTGQSTHRMHGADTTLDQLGHALAMAISISESDDARLVEIAGRMLVDARTGFVENGLERFISALRDDALAPKVRSVIVEKRESGDLRGAGNLLPALASLDVEAAWELIRVFTDDGYSKDFAMGVARALERIDSPAARRELEVLQDRDDLPGASHVARQALGT